ncbi:MAG: membrane dipeptidase [Clostridia bacterium]|nr:membrane dipeptidase [Clostridia bacterium]
MKLFDLHCDTLYEMYKRSCSFTENELNISLKKAEGFEKYAQVLAIWSQNDISEEARFEQFLEIYNTYKEKIPADFPNILAVEGGGALAGNIKNLELFYSLGVRFLTLVWGGESSIGGAHNTDKGLSDFGYEVLKKCFDIGIIPDVSHASDKMFWQVNEEAQKCGKPFVATHSNSRKIHHHTRNLSDEMFKAIEKCGGVVGISLEPTHASPKDEPDESDICRHIIHYLELGGENTVCLGCDLDGVTRNIKAIPDISHLYKIADFLKKEGLADSTVENIFYNNANNFIIRNIKL